MLNSPAFEVPLINSLLSSIVFYLAGLQEKPFAT